MLAKTIDLTMKFQKIHEILHKVAIVNVSVDFQAFLFLTPEQFEFKANSFILEN